MRDRNKNRIIRYPDFLRYSGEKMTGKERNSFEKELQRDPFTEEASEGFASITPEEAQKDISSLHKQLKKRTERRQRLILLRLAATVAVLMIVSSIFIIIERRSTPKQIASNIELTEPVRIIEPGPVAGLPEKKEHESQEVIKQDRKAERPDVEQKIPEPERLSENSKAAAYQKSDSVADAVSPVADKFVPSEQMAVIAPTAARGKKRSAYMAEGKVISSEDNMPVAGVTVFQKGEKNGAITDAGGNFRIVLPDTGNRTLIADYIGMKTKEFKLETDTPVTITLEPDLLALNEIVVTAYGISRDESEMEADQKGYIPPQPSVGKSGYDKYIRENLQWPDTASSGRKIVVVVSFSVHTDGRIDSIMIVKSPGKSFSGEAIRLIRSGPAWEPARENGKVIEDRVRLRIIFK